METGKGDPQPSLGEVFKKISSDESLQTEGNPFVQLGREFYDILTKRKSGFTKDAQKTWKKLEYTYHPPNLIRPRAFAYGYSDDVNKEKEYAIDLEESFRIGGDLPKNWSRSADAPVDLRYLFYGYGYQALDSGNVAAALVALDAGNWLDDNAEGPKLQKKIAKKIQLLDPRAKIEATQTWERIEQAKASSST